jgi:hypothetical protein
MLRTETETHGPHTTLADRTAIPKADHFLTGRFISIGASPYETGKVRALPSTMRPCSFDRDLDKGWGKHASTQRKIYADNICYEIHLDKL